MEDHKVIIPSRLRKEDPLGHSGSCQKTDNGAGVPTTGRHLLK